MKETLPEFDNMRVFETRKPFKSFFNLEMKRTVKFQKVTIVVAQKLQKIECETQPEHHLVIHLIPSGWISGKLIFGGQMVLSCSVEK